MNGASSAGFCGNSVSLAVRAWTGSSPAPVRMGTALPWQMEFGVRVTF